MSTKIGVAIRVRPFLQSEKKLSMKSTKLNILPVEKEIRIQNEDGRGFKSFKFDKVLDQETTQDHLFHQTQIQDLINKVVEGYHSTIFAYGQTGSGKTYTMEGYKYEVDPIYNNLSALANPYSKDAGIIPRAINTLFESIKSYSKLYKKSYTVYCSYLQIYNERIYDLLNPSQMNNGAGLKLRWTQKDQFAVENLFVFECRTAEEVLALFHQGIKNKIMASHKLNLSSSRSHCLLSLRVDSLDNNGNINTSKLDLVDLAGSERTSLTGNNTQIAQKESIEINKSLFTLRQVIAQLADMQKSPDRLKEKLHIPYRDSKLTCLLKQSIGGNSYCLMIACLAPADRYFEENLSTLTYATKAAYISNDPMKPDDPKTRLISDLKVQVSNLSKDLEKATNHINFLSRITNDRPGTFTGGFNANERRASSNVRESSRGSKLEGYGRPSYSRASENTVFKTKIEDFGEETGLKFNKQASLAEKTGGLDDSRINDKHIESLHTMKDFMKLNKEGKERMDKTINFNDTLSSELEILHKENKNLREKLTIYENLWSGGGRRNQKTMNQGEEVPLVEGKIDYNTSLAGSPKNRKTNNLVHELAEEVLNPRRTHKGDKMRETDFENSTFNQRQLNTSNLLRGRSKYSEDDSFQAQQYYQTLIANPKQKYIPEKLDNSSFGYSHARTASTPPKEDETENLIKTNFGRLNNGSRRTFTPEINHNKYKQKDMRLTGSYLPQLKDNSSDIVNDLGNNTATDISSETMKRTNNVWLNGVVKRRANSTLKKIRNEDSQRLNRTFDEINRNQTLSGRPNEL